MYAPLVRSQGGSIKAIIEWLHTAGHQHALPIYGISSKFDEFKI